MDKILKVVDVIIVNFNSTDYAIQSISAIKRISKDVPFKIVVFDNASADAPERILDFHPGTNLILNSSNIGYSRAINLALETCSSPYVLILNPDTFISGGPIGCVIEYLEHNRSIGIIGPKILEEDGSIQGSARRYPSLCTTMFGRKSLLTRLFPGNPITKREFFCFNDTGFHAYEVDWVSGACMFIRRKAIEEIKGFDEDYFLYWEDADLCKRMNDAGWKTVYYTKAIATHFVGKSSDTAPIQSIGHFHHSSYKYFMKHSNKLVKWVAPIVILGLSIRYLTIIVSTFVNRKKFLYIQHKILNRIQFFIVKNNHRCP
ncbi:MAG: glycosyltransferase family 2 protein [Desulfatitalea sp.]|nr:glycosyltransferase family 2 protein [Desulfatitalea sp.]NNK00632.1 glycosyltransferase family 2 protein [Desulfatitalea sp.]